MNTNYIIIGDSITYGIGDFENGEWATMFKNYIVNKDDSKVCNNYVYISGFIREIQSTNFLSNYDIYYATDEVMGFDYPVREACKILNERGYKTYWSSANIEDYLNRKGQVVKDKSVAYINDDLKKKLLHLKKSN